ncbi:DUF3224 domain-containing protein [Aliiglaciecola sp. LCG003]|uniref:DUF3224 domain-containing protein n=1 Tax=Aliiglaciecola sp. LCG003 TaxID=3053655 RepID=UPI0025731460|nr:DUF3224 domain-containing protein [Aliiglaciecola sp. LCG003]WJG09233.1 DUF3224 domain-containing protein [Aliiglaciecola sp. LCG003]
MIMFKKTLAAMFILIVGNELAAANDMVQTRSGEPSMQSIKGSFEVSMLPQQDNEFSVGRMTLDKQYQGPMDGNSKGQMLSFMSGVKGSAGYVAIEVFTGKIANKQGSVALQHFGRMDKGAQALTISIIPDSGTDQLTGISGSMEIEIVDGKHLYNLNYLIK